jgi:extradiol dioxygenase family protein
MCNKGPWTNGTSVEADDVPVPHFGVALTVDDFHALAERLKTSAGVKFIIEPHLRFQGRKGEQWTMFFKDPSGNSLEFKAMTTPENLFAKYVEN